MKTMWIVLAALIVAISLYLLLKPKKEEPPISVDVVTAKIYIPPKANIYQVLDKVTDLLELPREVLDKYLDEQLRLQFEGKLLKGVSKVVWPRPSKDKQKLEAILTQLRHNFRRKRGSHPHSVLVLASLVEKEAMKTEEMRIIAGVFKNRMEQGMRLQTDPTTVYPIFREYQKRTPPRVLRRDYKSNHKWNTYKIDGLPPTPICTPSLAAILSVQNPAKHDYIYFVGKGDGTHYFSKTYKEHQARIKEVKERRKKK